MGLVAALLRCVSVVMKTAKTMAPRRHRDHGVAVGSENEDSSRYTIVTLPPVKLAGGNVVDSIASTKLPDVVVTLKGTPAVTVRRLQSRESRYR
jgi:hypothetical protein